ncbi:hypothetical protein AQUCO_01500028v1 [Aquilegia coerulea]|uniref:Thioglucosidase n=1 Tax=Aquilegia coerulea TaxID=218851 RepID=A0A2G5DRS6_AQUCA|nr:hypothetical protein AQUCO_01500028v1 [Aquilegia coerulea]
MQEELRGFGFEHLVSHCRVQRKEENMMRVLSVLSWFVMFSVFVHTSAGAVDDEHSITTTTSGLSRLDFPPGFVFGAGSSAYQVIHAAIYEYFLSSFLIVFLLPSNTSL